MQTGAATVESSMELPQKIKNENALWPSDFTSENISKETWNTDSKEYMHLYVHCSIICNNQAMEAAQVSISSWADKIAVVHYAMEYNLNIKKMKILPFVTVWMDLESIRLSEISQSEKDKYQMISLICRI